MINHARTLLLNQTPAEGAACEYIPRDYVAKKLPTYLQDIWNILFGPAADTYARNYRARQLLTILHSTDTDLVEYVVELDPRVTYMPVTDTTCLAAEPTTLVPLHKLMAALEPIVTRDLFYSNEFNLELCERAWVNGKLFTQRLAGLLLAFIYQVEAINEVEEH